MKFSANISTLFSDCNFSNRYNHALKYKYEAVECQNPYILSIDDWRLKLDHSNQNKIEFDLINSVTTFSEFENKIPTVEQFENQIINKTIEYAKFLKVKKVHLVLSSCNKVGDFELNKKLLEYGAKRIINEGFICLIEPLATKEDYYLKSYETACQIIDELKLNNLKLILDSFHLQKLHGNLTEMIEKIKDYVGHIQISQVPKRDSPMNSGEIDFKYFFSLIEKLNYNDYIGLEYGVTLKEYNHNNDVRNIVKNNKDK